MDNQEVIESLIKEVGVFYRNPNTNVCTYRLLSEGEYTPKKLAKRIVEAVQSMIIRARLEEQTEYWHTHESKQRTDRIEELTKQLNKLGGE